MFSKLAITAVVVVSLYSGSFAVAPVSFTGVPSRIEIVRCEPMSGTEFAASLMVTNTTGAPLLYMEFTNGGWGFYMLDSQDAMAVYNSVVAAKAAGKAITLTLYSSQYGKFAVAYTDLSGVVCQTNELNSKFAGSYNTLFAGMIQ